MTLPERRLLFYALGGGTGHLNRAYALARQVKRLSPSVTPLILSSAPIIPPLLQEGLSLLRLPSVSEHLATGLNPRWVQTLLQDYQPDVLVVDSHCNGVWQELAAIWPKLQGKKIFLRRDALIPQATLPYDLSWLLTPEAEGWLLNRQTNELKSRAQALALLRAHPDLPVVLLAHNGPPPETQAFFLRAYLALQTLPLQLRLVSLTPPGLPELLPLWLSYFPISELLNGVDLLMGGGGVNLLSESRVFGKRSLFCAFERPIDRQALRIMPCDLLKWDADPTEWARQVSEKLAQTPPEPVNGDKTRELATLLAKMLN